MCQGDNKTEAKGTKAMFVMKPEEVDHRPAARFAMYANIVINYQTPKEQPVSNFYHSRWQPHQLPWRIDDAHSRYHDIQLHWNSVLSTQQAKYMCLDLKNVYLSGPLNRYEYMCIPIGMFPSWIVA
jgi:hypothetical protein